MFVYVCIQVRFYWLHSNLDNSQLLHTIKLMSPVVKVNVYGNYLIVALRDGHITIYHLNRALLPTKGGWSHSILTLTHPTHSPSPNSLTDSISHSHSPTHSLTLSFTLPNSLSLCHSHSPTHSLTLSFTLPNSLSLCHSHSPTPPTHSLTHSFTLPNSPNSLTNSLIHTSQLTH